MEKSKLLTAHELASLLNLSVEAIWRYTREKRIPFVEIGTRQYRYNEEDVFNALSKEFPVMREEPAHYGQSQKLAYEDYAQIPLEAGYTLELIDGLLIRGPSPTVQHQRVASREKRFISIT